MDGGGSSNIYIYNAYTYVQLKRINIFTSKVFSLVFSDMDRMFAVMGANGFIGSWKLPSFEVICNGEAGTQA